MLWHAFSDETSSFCFVPIPSLNQQITPKAGNGAPVAHGEYVPTILV